MLERLTLYQARYHRLYYNEIIIDAKHWRKWVPYVVEAIVGDSGIHRAFLHAYGLSATTHPHPTLTPNFEHPFK